MNDHCHYCYDTISVVDAHAVFSNNQSAPVPALSTISSARTPPVRDATRLLPRYPKINILTDNNSLILILTVGTLPLLAYLPEVPSYLLSAF
jgi:hypothetical protein